MAYNTNYNNDDDDLVLSELEEDPDLCEAVSVILLGASGVGKTAIAQSFATGTFEETPISTIGIQYQQKQIRVAEGIPVNLTLYDTAGQERFSSLTRSYYRSADAAIVVFDVNEQASYERAGHMRRELYEARPYAPCILIGNKTDELLKKKNVQPDVDKLNEEARTTLECALGFKATSVRNDPHCADPIVAELASYVIMLRRQQPTRHVVKLPPPPTNTAPLSRTASGQLKPRQQQTATTAAAAAGDKSIRRNKKPQPQTTQKKDATPQQMTIVDAKTMPTKKFFCLLL